MRLLQGELGQAYSKILLAIPNTSLANLKPQGTFSMLSLIPYRR